MSASALAIDFVVSIPAEPSDRTLYVSMQYRTAVHLCACGCGSKIVTPLGGGDWILTFDGTVSLHPSVGNGQFACQSHYYIVENQIKWLPRITSTATRTAIARDRAAHSSTRPAATARKPWWHRVWTALRRSS